MPWAPIAAAAVSAGASIYSQNKAQKAADQAAKDAKVDINALDEQTRKIAERNAIESAALEARLNPEIPKLRTQSNEAVLSGLNDPSLAALNKSVSGGLDSKLSTPLLNSAIAKAMQNLALGGKLNVDQSNIVTRRALANAGAVAPGSLNLGRDLRARDLGLSELDLANSRLSQATQLGGMEQALAESNDTRFMNRAQLIKSLSDSNFGRSLSAAQYGESIQRPVVGLDPSAIANLTVGSQNAASSAAATKANIYGQQGNNYMQFAGTLLGQGLQNYGGAAKTTMPNAGYAMPQMPSTKVGNPYTYGQPGKFGSF